MPISFSCGQCGKAYAVSDGLAGKRAVCKACGNKMTIPGGGPAVASVAAPPQPPRPRPAAPARQAAPVHEPAAEDLYGFDEAPSALPPLAPRGGSGAQAAEDEGPVKKKKKKGFFSGGAKKKSSGGSFRLTGVGSGGWRLGALLVFVVLGIIGKMGLASKSEMEGFAQKLIDYSGQATAALRPVKDPGGAAAASPKVKSALSSMCGMFEKFKDKKASKRAISSVSERYTPLINAAVMEFNNELERVIQIPGAVGALNIQEELTRLQNLQLEAQRQAKADGLN